MAYQNSGERRQGGDPWDRDHFVQAMHSALNTLDPQRVAAIVRGASAHKGLQKPDFIFERIRLLISSAQPESELLKVWSVLDVLATTRLVSDQRLLISAERCVIELQQKSPSSAVVVARQAIDRGLLLKPRTILTTVSKAWQDARTLNDIDLFASLFECALKNGALDLVHSQTIGQCDALLGALCDPTPSPTRISRAYNHERTIGDVASRLLLGARLAQTVMDVGLPFNDPRTAERISMTIRALSSVGSLVSLQAGYIAGPVSHGAFMTAARELRINVEIPNTGDGSYDIEHNARVGNTLLASALTLAHHCFASEVQDDGSVRIVHRYALPGATITTLFRELERNKIELGDSEREAIAVITYCALAMERARADNPDVRPARKDDELRPATLNTALGLVVRGVADAPGEPSDASHSATAIQRAECVSRILHLGLSKITDASFLGAAQDAMAQAFEVNDAEVERYTGWHDAIEARIQELDSDRPKRAPESRGAGRPGATSGWLTKLLEQQHEAES